MASMMAYDWGRIDWIQCETAQAIRPFLLDTCVMEAVMKSSSPLYTGTRNLIWNMMEEVQ